MHKVAFNLTFDYPLIPTMQISAEKSTPCRRLFTYSESNSFAEFIPLKVKEVLFQGEKCHQELLGPTRKLKDLMHSCPFVITVHSLRFLHVNPNG
ncbi:hypothetical protein CEXT_5701 [Caerostris extrusa]|uniref:Uncharacterized protein n=1 Tax=Caerostris extrusa TaxID=172846 RepID=A0AAV4UYK1_CAEEX|nr:hypothetical protein CEXT_5701 [Caerostris extrusa]